MIRDALAGAAATAAMSGVMLAGDRAGLMGEQPPTAITRHALRGAGVDDSAGAAAVLAPFAHLGFGVGGGVVFGWFRRLFPNLPGTVTGVLFGLGIWAISYAGWIPGIGILPPPDDDRPGRPAVMIAAHVVYGVILGRLVGRSRG